MGLPIWREPSDEPRSGAPKHGTTTDPTAAARSSIRRRPSIHRGAFPRPATTRARMHHPPGRGSRNSPPPPSVPATSQPPPLPTTISEANNVTRLITDRTALLQAQLRRSAMAAQVRHDTRNLSQPSRPAHTAQPSTAPTMQETPESTWNRELHAEIGSSGTVGMQANGPSDTSQDGGFPVPRPMPRSVAGARSRQLVAVSAVQRRLSGILDIVNRYVPALSDPSQELQQRNPLAAHGSVNMGRSSRDEARPTMPTPPHELSARLPGDYVGSATDTAGTFAAPTVAVQRTSGLGDRIRSLSPSTSNDDVWRMMRTIPAIEPSLSTADSRLDRAARSPSLGNHGSAQADTQSTNPDHLVGPSDTHSSISRDNELDCFSDEDDITVSTADFNGRPASSLSITDLRDHLRSELESELNLLHQDHIQTIADHEAVIDTLRQSLYDLRSANASLRSERDTSEGQTVPGPSEADDIYLSEGYLNRFGPEVRARSREATSTTRNFFSPQDQTHTPDSLPNLNRSSALLQPASLDRPSRPQQPTSLSRSESQISLLRTSMRDSASQLSQMTTALEHAGRGDDADLEAMRGILERLSRRGDIPDEWWMSAGLSRDVVGGRSPVLGAMVDAEPRVARAGRGDVARGRMARVRGGRL